MNYHEIMNSTMQKLLDKGADKATVEIELTTAEEFNVIFKELNLLRSIESQSISLMVIKDNKKATTSSNQIDEVSINKAVEDIMAAVEDANEDPAFDISPYQEPLTIDKGPQEGDLEGICDALNEFNRKMEKDYPEVLYDAVLRYGNERSFYLNSNKTRFEESRGLYSFSTTFSAKKGDKMSSMNYSGFAVPDLSKDLLSTNFTELLVKQATEQTVTKSIPENFNGEVLLMPLVSATLLSTALESNIGNNSILFKTSRFPDHLQKKIFDEKLTVHARPHDSELCYASHITNDGYLAEDATIIDKGVLKHYPISLYVSKKTGMKRTIGPVGNYVIETGEESFQDMIKKIKKGVFCARISYGSPNPNGDFSGVLKNSYYIEDGKIMYPISETMMTANLIDMFNNIESISKEECNFGFMKSPFMLIKDVYFSKK